MEQSTINPAGRRDWRLSPDSPLTPQDHRIALRGAYLDQLKGMFVVLHMNITDGEPKAAEYFRGGLAHLARAYQIAMEACSDDYARS